MKLYRDTGDLGDDDLYFYCDQNGQYWEFLDELPPMVLLGGENLAGRRKLSSVEFGDAPEWVQSSLNTLIELGYIVIEP